jgi:hypothetical protein
MLEKNERGVKRRTLQPSDLLNKSKDLCSVENVAEDDSAMPNWLQQALQVCEVCTYFYHRTDVPTVGEQSISLDGEQDPIFIPRVYVHKRNAKLFASKPPRLSLKAPKHVPVFPGRAY